MLPKLRIAWATLKSKWGILAGGASILTEADAGLIDAGVDLIEADVGLIEAGAGLIEAGVGLIEADPDIEEDWAAIEMLGRGNDIVDLAVGDSLGKKLSEDLQPAVLVRGLLAAG